MSMAPGGYGKIEQDLEALKQSLIYAEPGDISAADTAALAAEISAIRLQLKRLLAEQQALGETIERRALGR